MRQRRRQLQRHAAAGAVEYRIFGEVLSRDDSLLDALPEAAVQPVTEVWRQLGGLANITGWAEDMTAEMEEVDAEAELPDDFKEELERFFACLARVPNAASVGGRSTAVDSIARSTRAAPDRM